MFTRSSPILDRFGFVRAFGLNAVLIVAANICVRMRFTGILLWL